MARGTVGRAVGFAVVSDRGESSSARPPRIVVDLLLSRVDVAVPVGTAGVSVGACHDRDGTGYCCGSVLARVWRRVLWIEVGMVRWADCTSWP
ncbi:MAG: hypothetical protein M3252_00010 [Actinomycetota bacterium]|nr:hypothetical protein [Actinomycetota bacterium]